MTTPPPRDLAFGDRVKSPEGYGYVAGLVRDWSHPEQPGGWEHDVGAVPPVIAYRVRLDDAGDGATEAVFAACDLTRLSTAGVCDP